MILRQLGNEANSFLLYNHSTYFEMPQTCGRTKSRQVFLTTAAIKKNISSTDVDSWGKVARNAKCPSGSNKKYSAWLISKSDIIPLTVNDFNVINLLYSSNNTKLVVWTKKHSHLAQLVRASDC